eukprot:6233971-Prymnesium_polylepis.1
MALLDDDSDGSPTVGPAEGDFAQAPGDAPAGVPADGDGPAAPPPQQPPPISATGLMPPSGS